MINQEWIKTQAEQRGCPVTDLLALARQNDPFYVGTPSSRAQAGWFVEVWLRGGFSSGVHLRRLHYWCVSQGDLKLDNGKPYENTDRCWQYLCLASKAARYLGLISIADIADHKNPEPHVIVRPQSEPNARFSIDTPEFSERGKTGVVHSWRTLVMYVFEKSSSSADWTRQHTRAGCGPEAQKRGYSERNTRKHCCILNCSLGFRNAKIGTVDQFEQHPIAAVTR